MLRLSSLKVIQKKAFRHASLNVVTIEFVIWIVRGLKLFANKWYLTSLFTITPSSDMFMFSAELLILSPLSYVGCPWLIVRTTLWTRKHRIL